jgi:hypothetical protein
MRILFVTTGLLLLLAVPSSAQQRPLVTEDPETVGEGQILIEAGLDYTRDVSYPASGLTGNLRRMPLLGVSIGISSIAEIQIDGGLANRLSITDRAAAPLADRVTATGSTTSSIEDIVIGTKVRVLQESSSRPGVGLRFATKLPLASNDSGLGFDTTDFFLSLLVARTIESVRLVSNVGMAILGDPVRGDQQSRLLTYGVSFARAATQSTEVVGEVNGRANLGGNDPRPGAESRSVFRVGARHTRGTIRADAALLFGITTKDPSFGVAAGITYVFSAFQVP